MTSLFARKKISAVKNALLTFLVLFQIGKDTVQQNSANNGYYRKIAKSRFD